MKRKRQGFSFVTAIVLSALCSCSTLRHSDTAALQGTWKGHEVGAQTDGPCYFVVSGENLEFRGADPNEWYKGTFTLVENSNPKQLVAKITDCFAPKYVGKAEYAIYEFKDRTLTIAGSEPGTPRPPGAFNEGDARQFVFKKQ